MGAPDTRRKPLPPAEATLQALRQRRHVPRGLAVESRPPQVVILGAGPAGVGAAYQLARRSTALATVLEQRETVGGNAGSFQLDECWVDYGSHRLHPACDPEILRDLRELLGEDLRDRPRHGRIHLQGRWIHFPLKPLDLLFHLPRSFSVGVVADTLRKLLPRSGNGPETFAAVLERALGGTICHEFYFPYARKLWGLPCDQLSTTQARRRVSANSLAKVFRKIAASIPGLKPPGAGRFFYPRRGYGQISQGLFEAASAAGAEFVFGAKVMAIDRDGSRVVAVRYERDGTEHRMSASHVWSTLPISLLVRAIRPEAPADVLEAARKISFRGMILIYLVLEQDRFTEYDAHYFPEEAIPISRLSEPKNYSGVSEPRGRTVLCAELPSDPGSLEWEMRDEELGQALCGWLAQVGLPVTARVCWVVIRRLKQAYPVYRAGYERHFATMDQWLGELDGLLTFGRQGLFAHDNTHHALYMAYAAVECFAPDGSFDADLWRQFRQVFETHVVED